MTYSLSACTRFSLLVCSCKNNEHTIHFPSLAACSLYKFQQHSQKSSINDRFLSMTAKLHNWKAWKNWNKLGQPRCNHQRCHHIYVSTCLLRWKELMPFITPGRKERISSLNFNDSLMNSQHCRLWAKICPPDDIQAVVRVTLAPHQWATTWRVKLL